jgi:FkbH-like protein
MNDASLYWLPESKDWRALLASLQAEGDDARFWAVLRDAARTRLDFVQTQQLDRVARARLSASSAISLGARPVRLAVLASSTVDYLMPSIRVAGFRRGLWIDTYTNAYGQYLQELLDPQSDLTRFKPTGVLIALDTRHLLGGPVVDIQTRSHVRPAEAVVERLASLWGIVSDKLSVPIVQQTLLPVMPPLIGGNEHRFLGSPAAIISQVNFELRQRVQAFRVDILAIDVKAGQRGVATWHDPALWHRAKQEIHPTAAPLYGDLVARLEAARQGRSSKCLVLDLDNTIWGGVIGDDGIEGIVLGQGSAVGEAFVDFQRYAVALASRGVILAVCSKNDEATAIAGFKEHPEMVLRSEHIAAFVANWEDKATNLRRIAEQINIGVDALVFADDNPFERNLVRRELPEVLVPELPDDPGLFAACLSDAGYFEALELTDEDFERGAQYEANRKREETRQSSTDLVSYLKSLSMELQWKRFDHVGLNRIVQLINKTNQFNLTTTRYTEQEVLTIMNNPCAFGLQFRLVDHFGDSGIIAIVIGLEAAAGEFVLDTWLMSCRVLGRGVEEATLNIIVGEVQKLGGQVLTGIYRPSKKNGMVRRHYEKLGFSTVPSPAHEDHWFLDLSTFTPFESLIAIKEIV